MNNRKISIRQAFQNHLPRHYSLRLHMSIILVATTLSGVLFSKILFFLHVVDFRIRYPFAVIFAYLVFFACIKLWLALISPFKEATASSADWIDLPVSLPEGARTSASPLFLGGQSGGGGVSRLFESTEAAAAETSVVSDSPALPVMASGGMGDTVEKAADALGDENILAVVVMLVVLVATILISSVLLLYSAPVILSEAAFQGLLAASLIKRTRVISDTGWAGSIFKATWKPFALTFVVACVFSVVLHNYFPEAARLSDILGMYYSKS